MTQSDDQRLGVKSVHLAFEVLEAVAFEPGEIGVSELANKLQTTKGTVFRHLQTLVDRGYLIQNASTQRYRVGARAYLIGRAAAERVDIIAGSQDAMRSLRDETGETVVVSSLSNRGNIVMNTLIGKSPLEIGVRVGSVLEPHATAQGKAVLAFDTQGLIKQLRRRGLTGLTPHTVTDIDVLERQLEAVRAQGYATAAEEMLLGISALAAPVMDGSGKTAGSIAIVGSIQNIGRQPAPEQIEAVLRAAQRVSWNLGYVGHLPFEPRNGRVPAKKSAG
ncbi:MULTISPECIES: IclR family transcriptional regulator [unclassified Mesorhizobium]|uniref:IclR family transcriptional regulator n=1 Tax=unclassified Mesorhizobium TaxID=325217 RepID=UPI000FDB714C|nr:MULTISPECIES: IclR family transcriptional regulator [unclassified Mesorhizobium]TGQ04906.1 IclR family transcriptional regulator [Mesorhizobium sp. M2E.F.Ca.ET.219.01.1.1]TGT65385.1 IclR family transcriptional regulator [Mesorhizobium sp. M2E.F.Ca.ET.166.01.1.1]TGV97431.1 IclR family transcriptional regulator [Mesorhizobium sp. M2E.F.Ca.ET.154.01.1.1]